MPIVVTSQLPPPKDWEEFESLCADLFAAEWCDSDIVRVGRRGQRQHGVDIFGRPKEGGATGVQCKGKRQWPPTVLKETEVREEVNKAKAFVPPLTKLIIATTADDDAVLQERIRLISAEHRRQGLFEVQVLGWGELSRRIAGRDEVVAKYYGYVGLSTIRDHLLKIEALAEAIPELAARKMAAEFPAVVAAVGRDEPKLRIRSEVDDDAFLRKLSTASKRTSYRADIVQTDETGTELTLGRNLYVRRNAEAEVLRALSRKDVETNLVAIQGEPGTGKSSMLWALRDRLETDEAADAWLLDATELQSIFGTSTADGTVLGASARALFARLIELGRRPIVLIDTVDLALTTQDTETYLVWLLTELPAAGVQTIVSSRPGEARMLAPLTPHVVSLFDYSIPEFQTAVILHTRAFVTDPSGEHSNDEAQKLLDAAAQGLPIREICRNPLTLRMLYSIYAPHEINVSDVDVVALYRAFWDRRVVSDIRSDAIASAARSKDLSACAMRVALIMLVEGAPDLAKPLLGSELRRADIALGDLDTLISRGVLRSTRARPVQHVRFFHQTFFEHAAAVGLVHFGGFRALTALADRYLSTDGNLFLASVLERALVLAEDEAFEVRQEAERVLDNLVDEGPAGTSVAVYAFVHRRTVPDRLNRHIIEKLSSQDAFTIERLLGIAANASTSRRQDMIVPVAMILRTRKSRWVVRSLELLVRYHHSHPSEVVHAVESANIGQLLRSDITTYPQARQLYIDLLIDHLSIDQSWALTELSAFLSKGLRRRSEEIAVRILDGICNHADLVPGAVQYLEQRARLDTPDVSKRLTSRGIANAFGNLFLQEWLHSDTTPTDIISSIETGSIVGLALDARCEALPTLLRRADIDENIRAFVHSAAIADRRIRVTLARVCWSRALPSIFGDRDAQQAAQFTNAVHAIRSDPRSEDMGGATDILFHAVRYGPLNERMMVDLLGHDFAEQPTAWLDTDQLGGRVVEGALAEIRGAQRALEVVIADAQKHAKLASAVIGQIKQLPKSEDATALGVRLAVQTDHVEMATEFLERAPAAPREWAALVPAFRAMIDKRYASGNPRTRREAARLETELARLGIETELTWTKLATRVESENDDLTCSHIVRAMGFTLMREGVDIETRVASLLAFASGKEVETRKEALRVFERAATDQLDLVSRHIEQCFDLALAGAPDGDMLASLSTPVFELYRSGDTRVTELLLRLIERCNTLPMHACRTITGMFRRQFALVSHRLNAKTVQELLERVPEMNCYVGRMVLQAVLSASTPRLADQFKRIAEHPRSDPEIVSLARRLMQAELRTGNLGRWPELYEILGSAA